MKIVKMHEGNREAFDDFLAEQLNDIVVDNDAADKYFASFNLPVPVIPKPIGFFKKYKNKLFLLLLLLISLTVILIQFNNKHNDGAIAVQNNAATTSQQTDTNKIETNSPTNANNFKVDALINTENGTEIKNLISAQNSNAGINKVFKKEDVNMLKNPLLVNDKSAKLSILDTVGGLKNFIDKNEGVLNSTIKKNNINKVDTISSKQKEAVDSVYIIW